MKKSYLIGVFIGLTVFVGSFLYLISRPQKVETQDLAGASIKSRGAIDVVGTLTANDAGTLTTTTAVTTGSFASHIFPVDYNGQMDLLISFTPWESATRLELETYQGYSPSHLCTAGKVSWGKTVIETNAAATSTERGRLISFPQDLGVNLVASTTYSWYLPKDWSSDCANVKVREKGVTSSYGKLFIEAIKSN